MCFDKPYIEVTEGENVDLYVSVSRQLSRTISVKLIYKDAPINSATRNSKLCIVHHIAQNFAF